MRLPLIALALAAALAPAGSARAARSRPEPSAPPGCFRIDARGNSKATQAVFKKRHLQGGGPTWVSLLEPIVKGYTTFIRESADYSPDMPHFGVPNIVKYRDLARAREEAQTWYILDDEGDSATFCAGDAALREAVHADALRLNQDAKALEEALDKLGPAVGE